MHSGGWPHPTDEAKSTGLMDGSGELSSRHAGHGRAQEWERAAEVSTQRTCGSRERHRGVVVVQEERRKAEQAAANSEPEVGLTTSPSLSLALCCYRGHVQGHQASTLHRQCHGRGKNKQTSRRRTDFPRSNLRRPCHARRERPPTERSRPSPCEQHEGKISEETKEIGRGESEGRTRLEVSELLLERLLVLLEPVHLAQRRVEVLGRLA